MNDMSLFGMDSAEALKPLPKLTSREKQCLNWCADGKSFWETGVILGVTERTVSFHMVSVRTKLNASTVAHAVAIAFRAGILE